jgi:hypothetical protein
MSKHLKIEKQLFSMIKWACRARTGIGPKLCVLLHSYGDLCYRLHVYFLSLLLSTHNQHQNMCLCKGNELHHPPIMNYTQSTPKQSKSKSLFKSKTSITTLYSNHDSLQWEVVFIKVTNTPLYINQKETSQEVS